MKWKIFSIVCLVFVIIGCSDNDSGDDGHQEVSKSIDDIALAIFEHQVNNQGYTNQSYRFLELNDQDPKPEIVSEFEDSEYIVKPVSESEWLDEEGFGCGHVVDRESGSPGTIFQVSNDVTWINDTTITVWGGSVTACLGGGWGTYLLEWVDGEWVVKEYTVEIMS